MTAFIFSAGGGFVNQVLPCVKQSQAFCQNAPHIKVLAGVDALPT
jgi:hypothetical protein